jgi:cephalosporin hydroxylase
MATLKRLQEVRKITGKKIDMARVMPYIQHVEAGSWADIVQGHADYYKYLPLVVEKFKPQQVVELGSAAGTSALMMLSYLPDNATLYACSIPEPEGEFRFIKEDYPNLKLIRGDDLDLSVWGDIDLSKTDIWFWDTDHNYEQITAEYKLYKPFLKKGCLVFIDDINLNEGMKRFWSELKEEKLALPEWHTYLSTGFGVFTV